MPTATTYRKTTALLATVLLLAFSFPCLSLPQAQEPKPPASTLTQDQQAELDALNNQAIEAAG